MKLIKGILGCALAAGLTTFAANQAQAGTVISVNGTNILFSTVNLKLVVSFENDKGKISKKTVTSKQVLKDIGFNSNVALAIDGKFNAYVINTKSKTILENLTAAEILTINPEEPTLETSKEGKNGAFTENVSGIIDIDLDVDNEIAFDEFESTGVYNATAKVSSFKKDSDLQNLNTSAQVSALSGTGVFDDSAVDDDDVVITGGASVKGSGSVIVAEQGLDL
jgi:hypothetical protein